MEVKIRKAEGGWHQHHYEWQPENSETWYLISRRDICVFDGLTGLRHNENIGKFFNRLLQGEMITAEHCRYFRKLPLLLIEYGGGREDGKIGQGKAAADPSLHYRSYAERRPEACRSTALVSNLTNLNGGDNMGKKKQKEKTGYDPKAIREAAETLTGKEDKPTTEKPKAPTDDEILKALSEIGKPAGSREISDKLGIKDPEKGRAYVRNAMNRLAEAGKVKVSKSGKQYRYEVA